MSPPSGEGLDSAKARQTPDSPLQWRRPAACGSKRAMALAAVLDLMIRGGALALLLLWSWLLVRDHRAVLAARVAVAMNLAIIAHIVATIPGPVMLPVGERLIDLLFAAGSVCVPALFWLFARTWFNDAARIGARGWLALAATVALLAAVIAAGQGDTAAGLALRALLRTAMFGFAALGLWEAWRGRDGDLIEARRALRLRLVGAVGAFVILTNAVEVLVYSGLAPAYWRSLIELGILLLAFGFCAAMFVIAQPMLFAPAAPSAERRVAAPEDDALVARLRAHMERERPYRDETLTIAALAAQLGEQEYRLRRAINGTLGHRNFAQFLNGYRLAEVRAALADPAQRAVPILTIALDAGFGSLGPFNRAFREAEATTPSAWRAARLADSGID